jgi:hypothetical protein
MTQNPTTTTPHLVIRPQTVDEEWCYLISVIDELKFFKEHGYTVSLPNHPSFGPLLSGSIDTSLIDTNELKIIFKKEIYDPDSFKPGLLALESVRSDIEKSFLILTDFNTAWDFELFPRYTIKLTRYGPGGSFDSDTGIILILTNSDGFFKTTGNLALHIIHEIIHIGIQKSIVLKYRLTHLEKERLVDLILLYKFSESSMNSDYLKTVDRRLDSFITLESLNNLPQAIENYIREFPGSS